MRGLGVPFALLLAAATAAIAAPAAAQSSSAAPADHVYSLIGTWNCASALGSFSTLTYTRTDSATIALTNKFMFANGELGEFDETYRSDDATKQWTWLSTYAGHPDFRQGGSAEPWTGDTWTIEGTLTITPQTTNDGAPSKQPTRLIYTRSGDDVMAREIDIQRKDGAWHSSSSSVCRRTS